MKVYRLSTFITLLALCAFNAFAQDKADAITAFNAGLEQAQAKQYDSAISSFTTAMTIAEGLGADGEDIVLEVPLGTIARNKFQNCIFPKLFPHSTILKVPNLLKI